MLQYNGDRQLPSDWAKALWRGTLLHQSFAKKLSETYSNSFEFFKGVFFYEVWWVPPKVLSFPLVMICLTSSVISGTPSAAHCSFRSKN